VEKFEKKGKTSITRRCPAAHGGAGCGAKDEQTIGQVKAFDVAGRYLNSLWGIKGQTFSGQGWEGSIDVTVVDGVTVKKVLEDQDLEARDGSLFKNSRYFFNL
jgi:hypothetical protein